MIVYFLSYTKKIKTYYSHKVKIIDSKINIGPVADIIFNGWPENKAKAPPQTAPANIHSIVAFLIN